MKKYIKKGKFIVVDGIDGCGKGTQSKLLAEYFFNCDKRNHIFLTREPYNSQFYMEIRRLLKKSANPKKNAERMAELFIQDRKIHAEIIKKMLNSGIHVICDRYKYSTFAYQQTQGISLAKLIKKHEKILIPDLVVIIDIPIKIALKRIAKDANRKHREVFEQKRFQEKLRQNFLALPDILPRENIVIVDGNQSVKEVMKKIKKEVDKIFEK